MNPIKKLADTLLGGLLNRLDGWKSILGLAGILVIMVLDQTDTITPELAATLYTWASGLFGVGVIHKAVKKDSAES